MANLDHTSVLDILAQGITDRLTLKLLTEASDDAKAGLVRPGQLQDDPEEEELNILIHPGGEAWPDILNIQDAGPGMHGVTYTIGGPYGTIAWRRRFRIELFLFLTGMSREDARKTAQVVMSRASNALATWDVGKETAQDSFGEHAHQLQLWQAYLEEGGGEGDFQWTGWLWLEFLTNHDPQDL